MEKDWDIKYWFAKTCGWSPDFVDSLSKREVDNLISAHNREQRRKNREMKKQNNKNKGRRW